MRKLIVATALCTVVASAAEPRWCPDQDAVNALIFRASAVKFDWSPALTPKLTGFRAPAGFSLIGTAVRRDARLTRVAYKTTLPKDEAHAATMAAMGEGWEVESSLSRLAIAMLPANRTTSGTLCRNGQRRYVSVEDMDDVRYATINLVDEPEARACKASSPEYMPRLEFPEVTAIPDVKISNRANTFGTAGRALRVQSEASAQQLIDLLASQLIAQGWRRETGWSGKGSLGSTWRKVSEGRPGAGTLEVTQVAAGAYDVDFSVVLAE